MSVLFAWSDEAEAAVTLVINGFSQTVASGSSVPTSPSDQIQILVNGLVIDPSTISFSVNPPDVTLTLPDGQTVTLTGFVDLTGSAGGGLLGASGAIVLPSTLEALSGGFTDISVTKTDGVTNVQPGGNLTYTIVVTNNGPVDDPSVSLADTLPADLTCTYTSLAAGSASGNTVAGAGSISETLNMPAGSSVTYTLSCTLALSATGALSNTATATASLGELNLANNTATDSDNVIPDNNSVVTRTQSVVRNFMSRRADQITVHDLGLYQRLFGGLNGSGGNPFGFAALGARDTLEMHFATSLNRIAHDMSASPECPSAMDDVLAYDGSAPFTRPSDMLQPFDIWMRGRYTHVGDGTRESDMGLFWLGADYRVNPDFLVGVIAQFDVTDETDDLLGSRANGWGFMVGPYVVTRLHQNLIFEARGAWGESYNAVDPLGAFEDDFETQRWLLRAGFTGDFRYRDWRFNPSANVLYFEEIQKSFVNALGLKIPSQKISLGRVIFGPEVSHSTELESGTTIVPHTAIRGIWEFDEAEVQTVQGLTIDSAEIRARIESGVRVVGPWGWSIDGTGFYDGIGADGLEAYGGEVTLTIPLN